VVIPAAGGTLTFLETVFANAKWTTDSRGFIYYDQGAVPNLFRQMIAGGAPVPLTQFTSEQIFNYALSPDQKHAAVVRGRISSDVVLVATAEK
jgi:hypothetical protein